MNARFTGFGRLRIDGTVYTEDVLIVNGTVTPRVKEASRALKKQYGHTPLSEHEPIPWECRVLIVGTGTRGMLPITAGFHAAARERGVKLVTARTEEACRLLNEADTATTNAILHLTC